LQKERAKYKDLLSNVQSDMKNTKTQKEKEAEQIRSKHDSTFQQIFEEKSKLMAT
jgi:hypothetical protein